MEHADTTHGGAGEGYGHSSGAAGAAGYASNDGGYAANNGASYGTDGHANGAHSYGNGKAAQGGQTHYEDEDMTDVTPQPYQGHHVASAAGVTRPAEASRHAQQPSTSSYGYPAQAAPQRQSARMADATPQVVVSPSLSRGSSTSTSRRTTSRYSLADFTFIRTLGTGSFGRVHLVRSQHNSRSYAIKVLSKERVIKMKQVEHTNSEREMLERVRHPFLVNLWGTFKDSRNLYMVMDFVAGGELFSLLRKSQVRARSWCDSSAQARC